MTSSEPIETLGSISFFLAHSLSGKVFDTCIILHKSHTDWFLLSSDLTRECCSVMLECYQITLECCFL